MKNIILFIICGFLIFPNFAQNYNGPESVEYNPTSNSYFISNSNNGQILELDENNNLSVFKSGLNVGPHGLEIVEEYIGPKWSGQVLYVCSGGRLFGYDIQGNEVLNYNINGTFLNGITKKISSPYTANEVDLFITDFSAKKLYRYNIDENIHYEVCSFNKNPNGVYYDNINERLLVVFWGSNAPVYEIDIANGTYVNLINTGMSNLDGITMDQCGNIYISAWSSNAIHKYNFDFTSSEIIIDGLSNPADICYNQISNTFGIPNSGNNTVDFVSYSCETSSLNESINPYFTDKTFDLLGRTTTSSNLKIHINENGERQKKYILK